MTIGYEGVDTQALLATLVASKVSEVIDIREFPISRKKGFSKTSFQKNLAEQGIAYRHIRELGCPKEIRRDYYADGDWDRYRTRFNEYLKMQAEALENVLAAASEKSCCLVCFEADYRYCHRILVTDALQQQAGLEVKHLAVKSLAEAVG